MNPESVQWLQVENTTKCNAWCPGCGRNKGGFGLADNLVIEDLDLTRFRQVLEMFPNLETIQFCATYGDAIAAHNIIDHVQLAKQYAKKIHIHTHGGIRNPKWWAQFAEILKDINHEVWFAIDGLAGVHEIYRQGTNFDNTLNNAKEFINAGGHAVWQFIPFAHNEHQIKDCMRLSQKLGFRRFKFVHTVHEKFQGRHYQTGEPVDFQPWSGSKTTNPYQLILDRTSLTVADCRHVSQNSVYLNANGLLSPCCYLNTSRTMDHDQFPDIEKEINLKPTRKCLTHCGNGVKLRHQS
jgi:sulfatase maturation enzyme AslB (radical SAM superfamily)